MTTLSEIKQQAEIARLQEKSSVLENSLEVLQESFADAMLRLDDVGWKPLGGDEDATEVRLDTIKTIAQTTRGLVAINPLIKRGVAVRTTYIWGEGVKFEGLDEKDPILTDPTNKKFLFSPQAYGEIEMAMATEGNLFVQVTKPGNGRRRLGDDSTPKITRVPMKEITGTVSNPENKEDIWFYKREWTQSNTNFRTGQTSEKAIVAWFPATDYNIENGKPFNINGKAVVWGSAILHNTANKQIGWRWGAPDLMSVIFWTKAYKEFLENSATLVKAYSRFAFKVTAPTKSGVQSAATKVAQLPTRDSMTGEVNHVGGTAVMGMGATMSTVGRTAGSVDFGAGLPLAAMVAAGLEIPLTALTADGGSSNRSAAETLETPTLKAMKARQQLWTGFFDRLFAYLGKEDVKITWGKVDVVDIQRFMTALVAGKDLNVLHAEEVRELVKIALEITNDKELPTEEELGLMNPSNTAAGKAEMENAKLAAQKPPVAGAPAAGGKSKKPASAAPSYGDNSNRKAVGQHKYSNGRNG